MKNHRFPWLRNRTTDNRKCEKARNIKEKRTIEMFSTVSRQLAALLSSQRDNFRNIKKPLFFRGLFLYPRHKAMRLCLFMNKQIRGPMRDLGFMLLPSKAMNAIMLFPCPWKPFNGLPCLRFPAIQSGIPAAHSDIFLCQLCS